MVKIDDKKCSGDVHNKISYAYWIAYWNTRFLRYILTFLWSQKVLKSRHYLTYSTHK